MHDELHDRQVQVSKPNFAEYGILSLAYIKRTVIHGQAAYAAYAADGTYLWHHADEESARISLRQQEMEPLSVH